MKKHETKREKFESEIKDIVNNYKPALTPEETLSEIKVLLGDRYPNTTLLGRIASLVNELDVLHGKYEYHIALIENLERQLLNSEQNVQVSVATTDAM